MLFLYAVVCIDVAVLRIKKPDVERPFKAPYGRFLPYAIVLIFLILIIFWINYEPGSMRTIFLGLSFVLFGIPLYLLIELYNDPKMIQKVNDAFAFLGTFSESFELPMAIKKEIFDLLGDIKGKTVLEFGCNEGALTEYLAMEVGPHGKVYATNISEKELFITEQRLKRRRKKVGEVISDVELIYDTEHTSRIHPSVGYIDAAVSVGMLSYLTDVEKVLRELNALLPEHGRICFVEYVNLFKVLPDAEWLSDINNIKSVFREAGFAVHVKKKKYLLWNYLFIYGMKSSEEIIYI